MKASPRLVLCLICALLLAGAIGVVIINQNTAAGLRLENQESARAQSEAQELMQQQSQLPRLREENDEVQKLHAENKDLPRLRNQVRQLRREADEIEKLRADNQRLSSLKKTALDQNDTQTVPPGFIPKSNLADVGFGNPEAAVQTMFWAMCRGDVQRLRQVSLHGGWSDEPNQQAQDLVSKFSRFPGFVITGQTNVSPEEVTIETRTSASGTVFPVKLRKVGNEWKLMDY